MNDRSDIDRRGVLGGAVLAGALAAGDAASAKPAAHRGAAEPDAPRFDGYVVSSSNPVVETTSGPIRGYIHDGVFVFRGVPYGADTSGANRFLPPRPAPRWSGVRECLDYGPISPQPGRDGPPLQNPDQAFLQGGADTFQSEDCLRLNLWTPGLQPAAKRPVMVWIHGGGFLSGSGGERNTEGTNLARRGGVVVVTLNHRLGAMGYFNLAKFGPPYADSANVGMLDIVLALRWVQGNIARFGGDPGCVTVFGQSGGGSKINCLMGMPLAKGLFHRAVVESGATLHMATARSSADFSNAVLAEAGLSGASIETLRTVPFQTLVQAGDRVEDRQRNGRLFTTAATAENGFAPFVDGDVLPRHPFEPDATPLAADVPLMVGTALNEFVTAMNRPDWASMTEEQAIAATVKAYGKPEAAAVFAAYRTAHPTETPFDVYSRSAAGAVRAQAIKEAQLKAAQHAAPAYLYWFQWRTHLFDGRPGAGHGSEIPFIFSNTDDAIVTGAGARARALAAVMSGAWVQFARTGDPNHPGLPRWTPYSPQNGATLVFDDRTTLQHAPDAAEQRVVWETVGLI